MIELSVVIPTRNRAKLLHKTITSLLYQTINKDKFEVIVVDNGSSDDTKQVCEKISSQLNIQYYFEKTPGLHVGRNKGYEVARGEILVYADDDIQAFTAWLKTIFEVFQDKDVIMVGGKNLPNWECTPPDWLLKEWNREKFEGKYITNLSILDFGDDIKLIPPGFVWGCNFSVRKELIKQAEGFHPDGMPNELLHLRGDGETYISQLALDSGMKTLYHPEASVYHWVSKARMTFEHFRQSSFNHGISNSYTDLRNNIKNKIAHKGVLQYVRELKNRLQKRSKNKLISQSIEQVCADGYLEGYKYHQKLFNEDPQLRQWVFQKNYLDRN